MENIKSNIGKKGYGIVNFVKDYNTGFWNGLADSLKSIPVLYLSGLVATGIAVLVLTKMGKIDND